nr:hypothetical protein [Tanacetum cinerariifolium]
MALTSGCTAHSHILIEKSQYFADRLSETWPMCQILDSRNCVEVYCQEHAFDHHITILRHFYSIKSSVYDMCNGVKHALAILQVAVELGCLEIIANCVDYLEASPWEETEKEDIFKIIPGLGSLAEPILAHLQPVNPNTIVVKILLSTIFYSMRWHHCYIQDEVDNNVLGGLRKDVKNNQKIIVVADENMADKRDQHKQGTTTYIQEVGKANGAREALATAIEVIVIELGVIREMNLVEFTRLEKDVAVEEKLVLRVKGLVLPVEGEGLGFLVEGLAGEEEGFAGEEDLNPNLDNLYLLTDTAIDVEEGRLSIKSSVSDMCHGVKHALDILQVAVELGCPEIIATCLDYLEASLRDEVEEDDILKIILGLGSLAEPFLAHL